MPRAAGVWADFLGLDILFFANGLHFWYLSNDWYLS